MRRFTRLTNVPLGGEPSRRGVAPPHLLQLRAAHKTLANVYSRTRAMADKVTDHVCKIEETGLLGEEPTR